VKRLPFQGCAFVAVTTANLARARRFWAGRLGFRILRQKRGEFFMVDAAGVRLCVDAADGVTHRRGGTDPVIGLKVASLQRTLKALAKRGLRPAPRPMETPRGRYAELKDPDGRTVVLTEAD
jgi:catechol 2,3-dioxygenase-like lactoylglutathione lyase family enzyme